MRTTQQFSITLPLEMADAVKAKERISNYKKMRLSRLLWTMLSLSMTIIGVFYGGRNYAYIIAIPDKP